MITNTTETKEKEKPVEVKAISYDGIMSDADEKLATGLSRVTRWRLEREGKYPKRVQLSPGRVGRHGHEIKSWIKARPRVNLESCEIESEENL